MDFFIILQESKKWQERKEALEALQNILQKSPRLQTADYYELVNDLQKVWQLFIYA